MRALLGVSFGLLMVPIAPTFGQSGGHIVLYSDFGATILATPPFPHSGGYTETDAQAQQPKVEPGNTVRVRVPGRDHLTGRVTRVGETTLTISMPGGVTEVPFDSVSTLEVLVRPADGKKWLKGAGIGFLIGAGVGAAMGLASGDDESGFISFSAEEKAVIAGVGLGVIGALLGGIIGALDGRERWAEVPPPFAELGFDVLIRPKGSFALTLSRRF